MKRVLIAEDDDSTRKILYTVLSGQYEVVEARNGIEAIEKSTGVDVIVCDLNMPDASGFDVFEKRSDKNIPFIMLTVEGDADKKSKGKEAGVYHWLTKPFAPNYLLEIVNRALKPK